MHLHECGWPPIHTPAQTHPFGLTLENPTGSCPYSQSKPLFTLLGQLLQCLHSPALHLEACIGLKCTTQKHQSTLLPFLGRDAYNFTSLPSSAEENMSKCFHFRREADEGDSCAITTEVHSSSRPGHQPDRTGNFYN